MAKAIVWGERWEEDGHKGKGGQGLIYKVRDLTGAKADCIVKKLKEQKNENKRRRMYREVAAYQTLKHKGIPNVVDTNIDKYETEVPLFVITEYIDGPTLEEFITQHGPLDLDSSIRLSVNLIEIVAYCHSEGIGHRDIKPDNIILRGGNINDVCLIDFGLSFNMDDQTWDSPAHEQLANRFIHLPELNDKESKMDFRADVTYCAGIFFYVLTGIVPVELSDQQGRLPHQRDAAEAIINGLPANQTNLLKLFFDKAFVGQIDYRYQSIQALQEAVIDLQNTVGEKADAKSPALLLEEFKKRSEMSVAIQKLGSVKEILDNIHVTHNDAGGEVAWELGKTFNFSHSGYEMEYHNYAYRCRIGVKSLLTGKMLLPKMIATVTGSEVVISLEENADDVEHIRMPLSNIDLSALKQFVKDFLYKRLYRLE